jgi:hypothetical protein
LSWIARMRPDWEEEAGDKGQLSDSPSATFDPAHGLRLLPQRLGPDDARLTNIVVPPRQLSVACRALGEGRLGNELVGLVVEAVLEVVAKKEGEEGSLQVVVVAESGGALGGEKGAMVGFGEGEERRGSARARKEEGGRRTKRDIRAERSSIIPCKLV